MGSMPYGMTCGLYCGGGISSCPGWIDIPPGGYTLGVGAGSAYGVD